MKRLSTKQKLTIWIALLMLLSVALVLGILMFISNSVIMNHTMEQLENTLRGKLSGISKENGKLVFEKGFSFVENGVYTIIYSKSGALLAGQMPLSFPDGVAFQNGIAHTVSGYHVLDFRLPLGWQDSIWVRGVIPVVDTEDIVGAFRVVGVILLPLMVIISATGAYLLSRSTFRPIDRIISAAEAIGEGRDLSRRIGLPAGRDEISRMGAAFDRMFARLETSFETEKQFTSDASHELRTPLTSIRGWVDTLRTLDDPQDENYRKGLEIISSETGRLYNMVEELLDFSRLQNGGIRMDSRPLDLVAELTDAVLFCEARIQNEGLVLDYAEPEQMIPVYADPNRLRQVFINILDNAIKYSAPGGRITVKLWAGEYKAFVEILDQGRGIPPEDLENVKTKFFKGKNSVRGSGIGLALVDSIMTALDGTMDIKSTLGRGTVVTLGLPLYRR